MTAEGRLAVGSKDARWEELGALLAAELAKAPSAPVVLRVDKSVAYRDVQRLIAEAKKANAKTVSFGTEPPK